MGGAASIRYCISAVHVCQGQPDSGSGDTDSFYPENTATSASGLGLCAADVFSAVPGYASSGAIAALSGRLHGDFHEAKMASIIALVPEASKSVIRRKKATRSLFSSTDAQKKASNY